MWGLVRQFSLVFFLLGLAAQAHAAYTIYVYNSGVDTVAEGSGTINTAGITLFGNTGNFIPDVRASVARIAIGTGTSTQWQGIAGPASFGIGGGFFTSSVTGDFVGIVGVNNSIRLPNGYVSGTALANTARWNNQSLAIMGLTVGTYVWTWGAGPTLDSYTLVIGSAPPQPQTITFANPGDQALGTSPTVTATASSGLGVTFTSATPGVCTVTAGGALTLIALGNCTINANQAGNGAFQAAPQVGRSFNVVAARPAAVPALGAGSLGLLAMVMAMVGVLGLRRR